MVIQYKLQKRSIPPRRRRCGESYISPSSPRTGLQYRYTFLSIPHKFYAHPLRKTPHLRHRLLQLHLCLRLLPSIPLDCLAPAEELSLLELRAERPPASRKYGNINSSVVVVLLFISVGIGGSGCAGPAAAAARRSAPRWMRDVFVVAGLPEGEGALSSSSSSSDSCSYSSFGMYSGSWSGLYSDSSSVTSRIRLGILVTVRDGPDALCRFVGPRWRDTFASPRRLIITPSWQGSDSNFATYLLSLACDSIRATTHWRGGIAGLTRMGSMRYPIDGMMPCLSKYAVQISHYTQISGWATHIC